MGRTDDHLLGVDPFLRRVLLRQHQHALYPLTRPLLAERHLQDGIINWLPCDLSSELVQFPVRDLEVCRRHFVL